MISEMKLLIVVGARPNFMKAAPILKAVREFNGIRAGWAEAVIPVVVHTGQHYDARMSEAFFTDLDLPAADVFLGAGSGSHAEQTAEIMHRFEPVLIREKPQALMVVGDVNSTLACALVAAKLPASARPLIAHVEAGLRSFDRAMPEEINRILTDQLSDLLFTTEQKARRNLLSEGIPPGRIHFVGNTMIDSLFEYQAKAENSRSLAHLALQPRQYALLTLHRPGSVDEKASFTEILEGLTELASSYRVVFPVHPRTGKQISSLGLDSYFQLRQGRGIQLVPPQGYLDFLCLMKHSRLVVTDSGGIQEETTALGVPCVTVRENTERPVTVEIGTNVLAGVSRRGIQQTVQSQLVSRMSNRIPELWDGRASARIVGILAEKLFADSNVASAPRAAAGQIPQNAR
jgi:UDP-N-acetylglucosamine 2-epimerase (non-hydrolysing)